MPRWTLTQFERRFWTKVDMTLSCWFWTGHISPNGYPGPIGGEGVRAHRWAYEYFVGPIPEGYDIDHLCRNRACVNPAHLEPVTRSENIRRGLEGVLKQTCKHGHPWAENRTPNGRNSAGNVSYCCRACVREYQQRKREGRA